MNERFTRAAAVARIDLAHEPDFTLGRMQVRPSLREIACNDQCQIIDRRVMRVLVALARATGAVVSRDDLIESCWDGVIVGEDAINSSIGRLRRLAEAKGTPFTIETVPRVGYRLKVTDTANISQSRRRTATAIAGAPGPPVSAPVKSGWVSRTNRIAAASAVLLPVLVAAGIALWRFWPLEFVPDPMAPAEASVAVLPFVNMSGDPKKDYFSDGFSEELINDLSNEPHLRVASRTSSFAFKGGNQNIETIARALHVHAIVEGSVRESGDRVRLTAQLIDARNGYHLWSSAYDRNLTDILSVQDELSRAVARALTPRLVPSSETLHQKIAPAVYRLFLEGIHQFNEGPPQGWRKALAIFKQVTAKAPGFAEGFTWLASAADNLAVNLDAAPAADLAIASDSAQRALSLDPGNLRGREWRAIVDIEVWDWRAAATDLRILRNQNPNSKALITALWNYYDTLGFPDEAGVQWRRLEAVEPYWNTSFWTPAALANAGYYQDAIRILRAQLVRHAGDPSRLDVLCKCYSATGQAVGARIVLRQLQSLQRDFDSQSSFQDCEWSIDLVTGDHADALKLLQIWESEFPDKESRAGDIGLNYVRLGEFDKADSWFERSYERREPWFFGEIYPGQFGYDKAMEKYRLTPQYKALAAKPLFKEWQAEHDRIAAALAAHRDPLN